MAGTESKPLYCAICGKEALFRIEGSAIIPLCGDCAGAKVLVDAFADVADGIARLWALGEAHAALNPEAHARPVIKPPERAV